MCDTLIWADPHYVRMLEHDRLVHFCLLCVSAVTCDT